MEVEFIYEEMDKKDYQTFIRILAKMLSLHLKDMKQKEVEDVSGNKIKRERKEK
jgi:hypothetical protein